MQANIRITCFYLALCHLLLTTTSPAYKHQLKRLGGVGSNTLAQLSFGYLGGESGPAWRQQLSSGQWRSMDLLSSVQQDMRYNASTGLFAVDDLVAYVSASDAIRGQGWKARATLFVQLMAPRYTLLPFAHQSLKQQMQLMALAAADLPAVGRLASAEDPSVGYRLTCTSPAMQLGLGPQPYAHCSVWRAAAATQPTHAAAPAVVLAARLAAAAADAKAEKGSGAAAQHAAADTCAASSNGCSHAHQAPVEAAADAAWGNSSSTTCSSSSNSSARVQQAERPLAYWIVLPTSYDEQRQEGPGAGDLQDSATPGVAKPQQPQPQQQQWQQSPLLGSSPSFEPGAGALSRLLACWDAWFMLPRTPLVQLLPAMTGMQQLVFANAVVLYSFLDMLQLITAVHRLHTRMAAQNPFLGQGWSIGAAACSISLQLLAMLACRVLVSALLAAAAAALLRQLMRGVQATALLMQLPTLQGLALALRLRRGWAARAGGAAAAAAAAPATVSGAAAAAQAGAATAALHSGNSSSGALLRGLAAAALRGRTAAAQGAAAKVAAALGLDAAGTAAAAGVLRGWLLPWHGQLLSLHHLCEDVVMLTCARMVWDAQDFVFDRVWRLLGLCVVEAHALVESAAPAAAMLASGASASAAWARFAQLWPLQRQRHGAHGAGADDGGAGEQRVQAQVFIQAPADMGQAAEALRSLADELEQLGVHPPVDGWGTAALGGAGGRRRVRQLLGQHWPAPLVLPFESEQLQAELGLEVPRGFVCPITQDIMRLPALLISSTVAVPATYDRDAISRWLEGNRRDPKSRQALSADAQLVPNMDLYRAIEDWAAEKQAALLLCSVQQQQQQGPSSRQRQQEGFNRWQVMVTMTMTVLGTSCTPAPLQHTRNSQRQAGDCGAAAVQEQALCAAACWLRPGVQLLAWLL
ncbi:hypothetical protein COO60DRAFT_1143533 [Scenedesmus sp. NREL 46B-D3]|nr:hypothetical protein COO60DRAFT_1143533 [Scenedesmus sp. NREL 46B-D3]